MANPFVVLEEGSLEARTDGDVLQLREEATHHLRRVRRLEDGDDIRLADGAGRTADARLCADGVRLASAPSFQSPPRPRMHVLQGLPKGRKIEEVVRTLTELGVARITPVETARTVRRLRGDEDKLHRRHRRWRAIARSACEQARRAHRPTVDPARAFTEALVCAELPLIAAEVSARQSLGAVLRRLGEPEAITLAVGPEGGWSPAELEAVHEAGGHSAHLGRTVLRTEHAATVLVAAAAYAQGWYG